MKCQICGSDKCYLEKTTFSVKYKGFGISIPDCVLESCDVCGEQVFDKDTNKLYDKVAKEFKRLVDGIGVT